jgi:hypothetical protein
MFAGMGMKKKVTELYSKQTSYDLITANSYIGIMIANSRCFHESDGNKGLLKPHWAVDSKTAAGVPPGRAPDEVEAGSPETDQ